MKLRTDLRRAACSIRESGIASVSKEMGVIAGTAATRPALRRLLWFFRRSELLVPLVFLAAGLANGAQPVATVAPPAPQTVLIIDGERHDLSGFRSFETGIREVFASRPGAIELFVEHLDAGRFSAAQSRQAFARFVQARYAARKIDLVLTFTESAAEFALAHRSQLFPRVPVVLAAVSHEWEGARALPAGIVTAPIEYDFRGTLELALTLQPDLREVVVVHGTSDYDRARLDEARQALERFAPRLRYRTLGQLSLSAIEEEVRRLPRASMVLQVSLVQNAEGKPIDGRELAGRLAAISAVPVYAVYESYLYMGALGGSMFDYTALGRAAAAMVQGTLARVDASAIRAADPHVSNLLVNWQALKKWRIPESRIPTDAQIRLRPLSPWDQYRYQILLAGIGMIVLVLLIVLLLLELARRQRAEKTLRESEARFRSMADTAPVLIWMSGPDKLCTFFNRGWLDFTGRTLEQEMGNGWTEGVHPDDLALCTGTYARFFDARESFAMEYRLRRHDSEYRWIIDNGAPRFAPDGAFLGYIGSCIDFTEHHELQRSRQELAHAARVSAMGELAGSLAHELNQPLTAILSNAQAAQRFMAAETIDLREVRESLGDVVSEGKRASEVIRRMRALVRKGEIEIAPLDIEELVRDVAELLRSDAVMRGVRVVLEIAAALPPARGDRVQLQQVVLNLLMNAFDAMEKSPPGQRVAAVRVTPDGPAALRVTVSDSGSGLNSDMLDRVFQPFHTTKREGLGLGLSICRTIIEAHGGRLHAENNAGAGATFYFTLPVDVARPARQT